MGLQSLVPAHNYEYSCQEQKKPTMETLFLFSPFIYTRFNSQRYRYELAHTIPTRGLYSSRFFGREVESDEYNDLLLLFLGKQISIFRELQDNKIGSVFTKRIVDSKPQYMKMSKLNVMSPDCTGSINNCKRYEDNGKSKGPN